MKVPSVFLYVIGRQRGPVKVGITSSPGSRLTTIQTGCPFKVDILHIELMRNRDHARLHERLFHDVYADRRLIGEWFKLDAELAQELIETSLDHELYFESRACA